jgi:hypothetical protein
VWDRSGSTTGPAPWWLHDDDGGDNDDGRDNDDDDNNYENDFDYHYKQNAKPKFESTRYMSGVLHATEWYTLYLR